MYPDRWQHKNRTCDREGCWEILPRTHWWYVQSPQNIARVGHSGRSRSLVKDKFPRRESATWMHRCHREVLPNEDYRRYRPHEGYIMEHWWMKMGWISHYCFVLGLTPGCSMDYTHLHTLRARQWIAATPMFAFCDRIATKYAGLLSFISIETVFKHDFFLSDHIKRQLRLSQNSENIFMPICIARIHWVSLLIRPQDMTIEVYDPQGKSATFVYLESYAQRIANGAFYGWVANDICDIYGADCRFSFDVTQRFSQDSRWSP